MQVRSFNEWRRIERSHTRHHLFRRVIILREGVFMRNESSALDVGYVIGNSTMFNAV